MSSLIKHMEPNPEKSSHKALTMSIVHSSIKNAIKFLLVLCLLFAIMVVSALIPREAVRPKMLESAEYMCERQSTFLVRDFLTASVIGRYADCITISIAYYLDENHPVESAMWTSFYGAHTSRMNELLLEGISEDLSPNQEYLRYWHGSSAVIRFLHLFWNIRTIYIFHAILMAGLYILLLYLLIRNGMLPETLAFTLSMVIVSVWYVPLCLEYTWMFLVMLVAAILAIRSSLDCRYSHIGVFFLVTGMVAAYLDFLTTETLTLLIPLLFILRIRSRQGMGENWAIMVKSCISWGIGYVGMWVSKWILASVILNQNVMPMVIDHIDERLNGSFGLSGLAFIKAAIARNLKCLFPYEYGISGAVLVFVFIVVVVIIPVARNRVTIREKINKQIIPVYVFIATVPFIRFAVLRNHSYAHRFFTHRALASSILALCFIVIELVEYRRKEYA